MANYRGYCSRTIAIRIGKPLHLAKTNELWTNPNGAIWIQDNATDLQLRLCIIAHTGPARHRGQDAAETVLRDRFSGPQ